MREFLKKYFEAVIYLITNPFLQNRIRRRAARNLALRENKLSDVQRWKNKFELNRNWNERTTILAGFIRDNASVFEFGAGSMFLREAMQTLDVRYKKYTPSDIVSRNPATIICDLNLPLTIDLSNYDTVVFSGVLEYVFDIEALFAFLEDKIPFVILSYSCRDILNVSRLENGWLSDYTRLQLEKIFADSGYFIEDYCEWNRQSIYSLVKDRPE